MTEKVLLAIILFVPIGIAYGLIAATEKPWVVRLIESQNHLREVYLKALDDIYGHREVKADNGA